MPFREIRARESGELYLSPEGRWAVIRTGGDRLYLWNIATARPVRALAPTTERIPAVAVADSSSVLAPRIVNRSARLADLATGSELRFLDETRMNEAAAFSENGRRLAASAIGYGDQPLGVWETATGRLIFSHASSYRVLALSPCGRFLAAGSRNGCVRLWDLDKPGAEPVDLRHDGPPVSAIAISSRAEWVAAGSRDKTILLWHNRKPRPSQSFSGHEEAVTFIAITPGGRLILSGSLDRTLRLWLRGQAEALDLFQADNPLTACGISPEGHSCIARDTSGAICFLRR